jgi:hypothetical protein
MALSRWKPAAALPRKSRNDGYFSDELIDVNLPFKVEPSPFTAAMMAKAIPAAIKPYSIAVAPLSFFKNRVISCIKKTPRLNGAPDMRVNDYRRFKGTAALSGKRAHR